MWDMFNLCKLVHADLSEYNMLWHQNKVIVIDLGQAVNATHPQALHYLKRDCETVTRFFDNSGMSKSRLMSAQSLFDLVCTPVETLRTLHAPPTTTPTTTTTKTTTTTPTATTATVA